MEGNHKLLDFVENVNYDKRFLNNNNTEFRTNKNNVMFLPDFSKEREMLYIFGPSGSGKSWLTRNYAMEFKARRPNYDIFLFSKIEDDPSLVGLDFTPIDVNDEELLSSISLDTLKDSLVILDDTESLESRECEKLLWCIKNQIAQEGRHYNISCIITTHQALQYNKTRLLLNECSKYVIFPQSGGQRQAQNMFTLYGGLSREEFSRIKKIPSRWVMLSVTYPNYIVYENGMKLIN